MAINNLRSLWGLTAAAEDKDRFSSSAWGVDDVLHLEIGQAGAFGAALPASTLFIDSGASATLAAAGSAVEPLAATALPDLIIEDVEVNDVNVGAGAISSQRLIPGQTFEIEWDVRNAGSASATTSSVDVYYFPNGELRTIDDEPTSSLAAGEIDTNETVNFTIPSTLSPGTYQISIRADATSKIAESNEDNNYYSFFITVVAPQTNYTLVPNVTSMYEGGQITFEIKRSGDLPAETVYFSAWANSASWANGDYTMLNGAKPENIAVTFSFGEEIETVTMKILADGISDAGESFRAIVQKPPVSSSPSNNVAQTSFITITNPNTTYTLAPDTTTVDEDSGTITFTVTRSGDKPEETIYASTLVGTAKSENNDYLGFIDKAVSFTFGETIETFTVTIRDDSIPEPIEQFRVMIGRANVGSAQAFDISTVTITDDDTNTPPPSTDEVRQGTDTTHSLPFDELRTGTIDAEPIAGDGETQDPSGTGYVDKDWYKVTLEKGHTYYFGATSVSLSTNSVAISLYKDNFTAVVPFVEGSAPSFTFSTANQVNATQTYYFAVSAGGPEPTWRTATGEYAMIVQLADGTPPPPPPPPSNGDDYRDDDDDTTAPLGEIEPGGFATGIINLPDADDRSGDKDVFAVELRAGQVYDFRLQSTSVGGTSLPSGVFTIRDANFSQLELSGSGSEVHEFFRADRDGLYYVRVGSGRYTSDTGGYKLSITPVQTNSILDDWADDANDTGVPGSLNPGGSRSGTIEAPGDKDYFVVNLVAGLSYHFSVESEDGTSAGELNTLALSLRATSNFGTSALRVTDGFERTGFDWTADRTGTFYLRVGAGDDGGDTGSYRLSVGAGRTPPPPPPPSPPPPPGPIDYVLNAGTWVNNLVVNFDSKIFDIYLDDEIWNSLAVIFKNVPDQYELVVLKNFADKFHYLGLSIDLAKAANRISNADDWREALFVETVDWFVGALFQGGGNLIGAFAGAVAGVIAGGGVLSGPLGGIGFHLGRLVGDVAGEWVYRTFVQHGVREDADIAWDGYDDPSIPNSPFVSQQLPVEATTAMVVATSNDENDKYGDAPVLLDPEWYLATYPDAAAAIASGMVGSAYAHFVTIGIHLSYQPNSTDVLTVADMAEFMLVGDAAALKNSALFTQPLGQLAGDGVSQPERMVADVLVAANGPVFNAVLDANLSALAHRKAVDLVINVPGDPVAAASATNSNWALNWSDGSDFNQVFSGPLSALLGDVTTGTSYRLFIVASESGSPVDILTNLQGREGWVAGSFDTFGIAEFGGMWVVIVGDRVSGSNSIAPGLDTLATVAIYGSPESETVYTGFREGRLFGLAGDDLLVGSVGNDRLEGGDGDDQLRGGLGRNVLTGGAGNDSFFVANSTDTITELAGEGIDHVYTSVSYTLAPGVYVETLSTADPAGTDPLILAGNELDNRLIGNAGANILYGMGGIDRLEGLAGDDRYVVDHWNDLVVEAAGQGYDAVFSSAHYRLAAGSEVEVLSALDRLGTNLLDLAGNEFANALYGNAGANQLGGGAGDDWLEGGDGNDRLVGGADRDTASYATAGAAVTVSLALPGTAQNTGGAGMDTLEEVENLVGSAFGDTLTGNGLANVLDGRGGADTMRGGAGDDTYYVDNAGDTVVELAGEGFDLICTTLAAYSLVGTQVERLGALSDIAHEFRGNGADNHVSGGGGNDVLLLHDGGSDWAVGGGGNDVLYFGAAFGGADIADGGAGRDALVLQGNVNATFGAANLVGIESLSLQSGANSKFGDTANNFYDFNIAMADGNVTAGQQLIVNASSLRAGEDFTFNGSAELDGRFLVYGGHGVDILRGGAGNDIFFFEGQRWGPNDRVDGGAGRDALVIAGVGGLNRIQFAADSFTNIESISLNNHLASDPLQKPSYNLVLHNGNVAPGGTLIVNGSSIPIGQVVMIDGRAVAGGGLILFGGGGHDTLYGGGGADLIVGGSGADTLAGFAGADVFRYDSASDSTTGAPDLIADFQSGLDKIDLSRIDANSNVAGDQAFTWIGSAAFSGVAGQLRTYDADGYKWIAGDTNGDGAADLVIALSAGTAPLVQGDFLL